MGAPPPIFVINLERSTERLAHVTAQLAALDLPFVVHRAVDGSRLTERSVRDRLGEVPLRPQPLLGRRLTMGEIACGLSHLELYRRIEREHPDGAIILEDDVDLRPGCGAVLRALPRADLVLLGHHSARHGYDVGAETCLRRLPVGGEHRVARVCEFAMGAYGYFVTGDAAARLARHAQPVRMPADWVTGYAPSAGVRPYAITPPCIVPAPRFRLESEIGPRDGAGAGGPAVGGRTVRHLAGRALLALRKVGVFPDRYCKQV